MDHLNGGIANGPRIDGLGKGIEEWKNYQSLHNLVTNCLGPRRVVCILE